MHESVTRADFKGALPFVCCCWGVRVTGWLDCPTGDRRLALEEEEASIPVLRSQPPRAWKVVSGMREVVQGTAGLRARSGAAPTTPPSCSHCPGTGSSRLLRPPATLSDHQLRWLLLTAPCFPASHGLCRLPRIPLLDPCTSPRCAPDGHRCPGSGGRSPALTGPALPDILSAVRSGTGFAHPQGAAPGSGDRIGSSEWRRKTGEPLHPQADLVPPLCGPQPFLSSHRDGKV